MASSGNFNTNKYTTNSNGTIGLNLSWSITSQSTANNTSTIHWVLKSNGTMSGGYFVKGGPITVTIGGVTVLNITSRINVNGSGAFSRSGDITITHDESGDKSVSMSVRAALYSSAVNCTGSKTYALDHIDRYAIIDSATDFNDEENPTITYSNPTGSEITSDIYVRLTWTNGDTSESTDWSARLSDEGGSYTFDLDSYRSALRSACPDSNTLSVTVDLKSLMYGVERHDTKVITMNIVNAAPLPGAVTFEDTDAGVVAVTGNNQIIVQAQSSLRISTADSEALKGSSIVSYSLNFNGVDTDITSDRYLDIIKPSYYGTYLAEVKTTDSRGNTATATVEVPITAWTIPTAENQLERINGFETNTILTVKGSVSTVPGSSMSIAERHRILNGAWSSPASVPDSTPTTLALDNTKEWEVEVSVWDSFTSANPTVYILTVGKGIPIMFIDTEMNSVGINKFPDEDDQLYVEGKIKATGNIQGDKIIANKMSVSGGPVTFSKSSGSWSFTDGEYTRSGNVVQLRLAFKGGGSNVAVANNAIAGTVHGAPVPIHTVRLQGYYYGTVLMGELTISGSFNIRILGQALNLTASNGATVSGTYIVDD